MRFIQYFTTVAITVLLTSCASSYEYVDLHMHTNYPFHVIAREDLGDLGALTELVPDNENEQNWTRMITNQYMNGVKIQAANAYKSLSKLAKEQCGVKFSSKVLKEDSNSITFEWKVVNCKQHFFVKPVTSGVDIESCSLNYFTGLIFSSQQNGTKPKCDKIVTEYEIARILKGNEGLQRVAYTVKGKTLNAKERDNWLKALDALYIKKDGKKITLKSN